MFRLTEELGVNSKHDEVSCEMVRGIRLHFAKFLKGKHTS